MNEKELRSYLKEHGYATVWIFQKDNHIPLRKVTFKRADIRAKYFGKVVNYLKYYHGELTFKLED
ncbi:TPA: hypothetical protein RIO42_005849 [Bacillus anthracis]|nr:hypothetical protein [Bacillus anthracis]